MPAKVRQTDCRTGWQVIDERGRIIGTFRRWETAAEVAAIENGGTEVEPPLPAWLHETEEGFSIIDRE